MEEVIRLVTFVLGGQRHAIALAQVEQVVSAVQVTPVPRTPAVVLGVIDFHGQIIAVLDVRARLQATAPLMRLSDQFLIIQTRLRKIALVVDETLDILERDAGAVARLGLLASCPERQDGVLRLEDGLALIDDVEQFLSAHESRQLDQALATAA